MRSEMLLQREILFHFSCHLSKIIWKTKKRNRVCVQNLLKHIMRFLFFTSPEYAYSGRRSRSPSTTSTGGSGGRAAPGLCFRAGLRSVRGGFNCHPVRLSFSRLSLSLPPFLVQSTSSKKPWTQMRESLRISASASANAAVPHAQPQNTVCRPVSRAPIHRPDRRIHRGLACDSFSAEGHWSPRPKTWTSAIQLLSAARAILIYKKGIFSLAIHQRHGLTSPFFPLVLIPIYVTCFSTDYQTKG